jgi:lipopolysaccharide export LptBFGC system permease protein LptF
LPLPPFSRYRPRLWWLVSRQPWLLERYILLEVLRITLWGVVVVSLLYSAAAAFQTVRGGIQLAFIWPFLAKTLAYPLYFSIPMSLLFAVTLTYGRLVADLELNAARSHGMSYAQVYSPALVLGLVFCAASYYLNGWLVPLVHYERRNLGQYVLEQIEHLGSGVNRTILLPEGGGTLLVGAHKGTELRGVYLDLQRSLQARFVPDLKERLTEKLPEKVTLLAREGRIEIDPDRSGMVLELHGVDVQIPERISGAPAGSDRFHQKLTITEAVRVPLSFERKKPGIQDLPDPELRRFIADLRALDAKGSLGEQRERRLRRAVSEWHRRLAFSLSSLTFPFLGVALCLFLNTQNRLLPFLVGNAVVLAAFFPLLMAAASLGDGGVVPWLVLLVPNLAVAALGIGLTRKVLQR